MSEQHTPGPWLAPCGYGVSRFEVQGDGHRVAVVDRVQDARAISAVPDMLEALKGLEEAYCRAGSPLTRDERIEDRKRLMYARAAIAKATGSAT